MTDDHRLSVAPMMEWTDRHCRHFLRLLSPHAVLYTEMITTGAVLHGDRGRLLDFDAPQHPLVLQLGGSNPHELAQAAKLGAAWGYDAINLNCGCPSDRVQSGRFGACLMAEPDRVAGCIASMADAVPIPVTVKCRIGIEPSPDPARPDYDLLAEFVAKVSAAGAQTIVLHARNAVLDGLSPKENREIPPLRYSLGYRLKEEFPALTIVLNGGIETPEDAKAHLGHVDGVMIGRAAYQTPFRLAEIEHALWQTPLPSRHDVVDWMIAYAEEQSRKGVPLRSITRHMLGLFQGLPGARAWRRLLSGDASRFAIGPQLLAQAASYVRPLADVEAAA